MGPDSESRALLRELKPGDAPEGGTWCVWEAAGVRGARVRGNTAFGLQIEETARGWVAWLGSGTGDLSRILIRALHNPEKEQALSQFFFTDESGGASSGVLLGLKLCSSNRMMLQAIGYLGIVFSGWRSVQSLRQGKGFPYLLHEII